MIQVQDTDGRHRLLNPDQIVSVMEYGPDEVRIDMTVRYVHVPMSLKAFRALLDASL